MPLTPEDTNELKKLFNDFKQQIIAEIDRKINTAITNIERKMRSEKNFEDIRTVNQLRKEIQTSEDNIKEEIKKQFKDKSIQL